mmetsp:Transcript_14795/g.38504  ORF Transcript_14795/g.38504 Transcript_14795/m.38504 type:complete len:202 (+) Transcript_14795:107-712(+)
MQRGSSRACAQLATLVASRVHRPHNFRCCCGDRARSSLAARWSGCRLTQRTRHACSARGPSPACGARSQRRAPRCAGRSASSGTDRTGWPSRAPRAHARAARATRRPRCGGRRAARRARQTGPAPRRRRRRRRVCVPGRAGAGAGAGWWRRRRRGWDSRVCRARGRSRCGRCGGACGRALVCSPHRSWRDHTLTRAAAAAA